MGEGRDGDGDREGKINWGDGDVHEVDKTRGERNWEGEKRTTKTESKVEVLGDRETARSETEGRKGAT